MEDIDLKVFSLNCNGLHDNVKHTATMQKLKKKGPGIYLLQETHSTSQQEFAWATTWGFQTIYFSYGTSNSRGVAILITSNYDIKVHNVIEDEYGLFLILDIERNGSKYTIGNIYMPTRNHETEQRDTFA